MSVPSSSSSWQRSSTQNEKSKIKQRENLESGSFGAALWAVIAERLLAYITQRHHIITDICDCRSMGNCIAFNFNWDLYPRFFFLIPSIILITLDMTYTFPTRTLYFTSDFVNLCCIGAGKSESMKNSTRFIFMKIMKLEYIAAAWMLHWNIAHVAQKRKSDCDG